MAICPRSLIGAACLGFAACYALCLLLASLIWRWRSAHQRRALAAAGRQRPPVSILKPLCGAEPGLYENLASFCRLDYPAYQLVLGVRDPTDPALAVAERLQRAFPARCIDIVVNGQQHGSNRKVSNLINMLAHARHELLLISDSDAIATPDYLDSVTAPLADPAVGLVTTPYESLPTGGLWSRLGAMYVNDWYMPSVLLAALLGHDRYASGQTLCLRRETLRAIGGLEALGSHLADDYRLGELIAARGLRIVLSPYALRAEHYEPSLRDLIAHETRWMRTLRILRPRSFPWLFLSFSVPLALLGYLLAVTTASTPPLPAVLARALLIATLLARLLTVSLPGLALHASSLWRACLLPLREGLMLVVWLRAFFAHRLTWRGNDFEVDASGSMRSLT